MADDRFIPPPLAPAVSDFLITNARDILCMIVDAGGLTVGGDGKPG
jgi:hypothetical protein